MWRLVNPFEASVALAAIVIGLTGVLSDEANTGTLAALWPGGQIITYFVLLLLGGLAMVLGISTALRRPVGRGARAAGLMWRAGLVAIASAWGIYGVVLLVAGSVTVGVVLTVLSLAALVRLAQLSRNKIK